MKIQKVTMEELIQMKADELDWDDVSLKINITQYNDEFVSKFQNRLNWEIISRYQFMDENFLNKWKDFVFSEIVRENERIPEKTKSSFLGE